MNNQTICFFNSCRAWGGGEKWHYDMAKELVKRGHRVLIICYPESGLHRRLLNGIIPYHTIRTGNLSFLNPWTLRTVTDILKGENVQTIILNSPSDLKTAGFAAHISGVPGIIYRRGSAIPVRNTLLNRYLYGSIVTDIVTNSEETKRTVLRNLSDSVSSEKIHVIYNGIDSTDFDRRGSDKRYTKATDEIVIGNAGRLVEQKGQRYLVDLAKCLTRTGVSFRILIAGTGPLEHELKDHAIRKGVSESIEFPGFVDDIKEFMETIDIYVHTSVWEGFGYVLVEAMASEKPVVAFDISSNPEIVEHGNTGYLINAFDVEEMALRIERLASDRHLRRNLGVQGRERVEKRFTLERAVRELESLIEPSRGSGGRSDRL